MHTAKLASRLALVIACVAPAAPSMAQAPDGRWTCIVGGVDVELAIAGEQATLALANGERYTLKLDPTRNRPFYTDGKVALRVSGGGPESTRGPEFVRRGEATTLTRCMKVS